jgi:hypothetical protein
MALAIGWQVDLPLAMGLLVIHDWAAKQRLTLINSCLRYVVMFSHSSNGENARIS